MKVSIIIPAYNAEKYIAQAIESVRVQTYKDWECIIVDDGSTDGTEAMALRATSGDDRFTVVMTENNGQAKARNLALGFGDKDAVFFLDADDYLAPKILEYLVSCAEKYPSAGRIVSPPHIHWKDGRVTPWTMEPTGIHRPKGKYMFADRKCDTGHVTGCLYILDRIPCDLRFPEVPMYEDMLFNMRLIFAGVTTYISSESLYHYCRHSESLSYNGLTVKDARLILAAFDGLVDRFKPGKAVADRCRAFLIDTIESRFGKQLADIWTSGL